MYFMCTKKQTVYTRRREHHGISVFLPPPSTHPTTAALSSSSPPSSQVVEPRRQAVGGGIAGSNRPAACLYTAPAAFALPLTFRHDRAYNTSLETGRSKRSLGRPRPRLRWYARDGRGMRRGRRSITYRRRGQPLPRAEFYATLAEHNDKLVSAVVCKSAARGGETTPL